jgi:hypothetical protein
MYFLKGQEMYANDVLNQRGHIFLNEIYRALGFDDTQAGAVLGWVKGQGDDYVDFGLCNQSRGRRFVNGTDQSILLTFNHDGVIWDKIS